eukprot:CAMPEP_0115562030 /NCGR_PEP_ID=MMETSP0271-20121206/101289_1 /TAXON_ID=71861 /ORGANISM="Scrippsiella trochoidea, Strain CCMP3099" /LENGTH=74 /DNA_ID=CAMNT_0002996155 /DNA_START=109 /DNA_END=333 /DNA_ORIENTATION=+
MPILNSSSSPEGTSPCRIASDFEDPDLFAIDYDEAFSGSWGPRVFPVKAILLCKAAHGVHRTPRCFAAFHGELG